MAKLREQDIVMTPFPNWANRHKPLPGPVIDCSQDQDMARQEFAKDADINVIVARLLRTGGVLPAPTNFAAVDYTADLTDQYMAVQELREAHHKLVEEGQLQLGFMEYLEKLSTGEPIVPEPEPTEPTDPRAKPRATEEPEKTPKASA